MITDFPRTCFACTWYVESFCRLHEEDIDSEIFAASNCEDYEPR